MTERTRAAPVLETARLRLTSYRADHAADHAALLADGAVMRHLGGPLSREDAWRRLLSAAGLWPVLGYGYWVVERRSDGAFLGQLGFADFHRDLDHSLDGLPEMGWMFVPAAQGQGIASEAAVAALEWIDQAFSPRNIPAIIHPDNEPSLKLAARHGFTLTERTTYKDAPILILRRYR
jgi:RimJ/RimL family protein N-acetyltransferase